MASVHKIQNRVRGDKQVHVQAFTGTVAGGNVNNVFDIPPGTYNIGVAIHGAANNHAVSLKAYYFSNEAQATVSPAMGMVGSNSTGSATLVTIASTNSTRGDSALLMGHRGTLPVVTPITVSHGLRLTVNTTAASGSGTWQIVAVATEV